MFFLAAFFLLVAGCSALLAWGVYRLLRRHVRFAAPLCGGLWLLALLLLFPVPIHGGFLFSGQLWWEAWEEWRERRGRMAEAQRTARARAAVRDAQRFPASLNTRVLESGRPWSRVATEQGQLAYLHVPSGLVFSVPVIWNPPGGVTWEVAEEACRAWPPAGHWALPTQAELYLFWRDGGSAASPWGAGRFVSVLEDPDLGVRMTVRHLGNGPERLRCVARDQATGGAGISRAEIPLEDWNQFQLAADRYR